MNDAPTTEEPRSYAIGIPVAITVHPGGRVTFDFDLSEVDDIDEDEDAFENYGAEQVVADILTVRAAATMLGNHYTTPVINTPVNPTA